MVDLFAGAGGLSSGLREAGFQPLYANELVPEFAATYQANHPETRVESKDIRDVNPERLRHELGIQVGELDLVAGGPPCQGFSVNAPTRSLEDERNHLFIEYLRFVKAFQPKRVLIENVPGLVSFEGGRTLEAILGSLGKLGYDADVQILYAPHFGVPQTRWRTIILGSRRGELDPLSLFPEPRHFAPARVNFTSRLGDRQLVRLPVSTALEMHVTIADAISDLPLLENGERSPVGAAYRSKPVSAYQALLRQGSFGVVNHRAPRLSKTNLERLRHIPPGGNWTDIPQALLPLGMQRARRSDHTKRYGRPKPNDLASTILTKCDPHWGAYFHYEQLRSYSVREAARLQSFNDLYGFEGSLSDQFKQVGNAVPPLMAKAIGGSIAESLRASSSLMLKAS